MRGGGARSWRGWQSCENWKGARLAVLLQGQRALGGGCAARTAQATSLADGLDQPTVVIVAGGSAWVTEGQLGRLFAQPAQAPNLPFAIKRVNL
jgi:hypothetical protein